LNNNIPFPFAAHTQLHSELIDFSLPPAANKIYYWLLSRQKAGEEQEFDKADFDGSVARVLKRLNFSSKLVLVNVQTNY
jgi:hypothetical protein